MVFSSCRPRFTKHPLVRAVQGALTGWAFASTGLLAPPVQAQAQAGPQSVKKRFDIPPSQLDYALSLLKTQSGVLLSVDPRLTHGKTTAGLHGDYTVAEAFAAVLADSGLELAAVSNAVYVLRDRQQPAATPQTWVSAPVRVAEAEPEPAKPPEEPVQEDPVQLEPMVVTGKPLNQGFKADTQESATKSPLPIRETPQSISVITRESMDARQVRDLASALELAAGAGPGGISGGPFAGLNRFGGEDVVIRGLRIDSSQDFRIDGFVVSDGAGGPNDLALFERVEVIKGPSSSLYGLGSLAGFINRVSKKPQAERRAGLVAQLGSFDTYRGEFDVTGALDASERFAGRLIGVYEDSGSFIDGVDNQKALIAPGVSARLGERTHLLLQGYYQDTGSTPSSGFPVRVRDNGEMVAPDVPRSFYFGEPGKNDAQFEQHNISLRADHELTDRWLASLLLQKGGSRYSTRLDSYNYGPYNNYGLSPAGDIFLSAVRDENDDDSWAGELRLDGRFDLLGREHQALLGIEARERENERGQVYVDLGTGNIYTGDFEPDSALEPFPPLIGSDNRTRLQAVYGQVVLSLAERTRLIGGLRYDKAQQRNRSNLGLENQSESCADKSAITYRIGLSHDLTPNLSAFAAYATSFIPVTSVSPTGGVLEPETGKGIELGLKSEWFDQRLGASLAIFRQERDKVPLSLTRAECLAGGAGLTSCSRSAGVQEFDGIELEVSGHPLPSLTVGLAATWLDGEFIERSDPNFGKKPQFFNDRQTNVFAEYRFAGGALNGLGVGVTLVSFGERGGFRVGQFAEGYERVDLNFSYTGFEPWDLSLQVRNLFDERYIERVGGPGSYNFFGSPTAVLFRAEYRFDL